METQSGETSEFQCPNLQTRFSGNRAVFKPKFDGVQIKVHSSPMIDRAEREPPNHNVFLLESRMFLIFGSFWPTPGDGKTYKYVQEPE